MIFFEEHLDNRYSERYAHVHKNQKTASVTCMQMCIWSRWIVTRAFLSFHLMGGFPLNLPHLFRLIQNKIAVTFWTNWNKISAHWLSMLVLFIGFVRKILQLDAKKCPWLWFPVFLCLSDPFYFFALKSFLPIFRTSVLSCYKPQ